MDIHMTTHQHLHRTVEKISKLIHLQSNIACNTTSIHSSSRKYIARQILTTYPQSYQMLTFDHLFPIYGGTWILNSMYKCPLAAGNTVRSLETKLLFQ